MLTVSIVVILLALAAPPLAAWIWGRRLVEARADPRLPERWVAYCRATAQVRALGGAALLVTAQGWSLPLLLLMLLATAAASFPARRAVRGESWGLATFLGFSARFGLPLFVFWLLLAAAPPTIAAAGPWRIPVAAALALALVVWTVGLHRCLPSLMGARPVESPALTGRFQQLLSRSQLPASAPPTLLQAGPAGGIWAATLSIPHRFRPSVIIGRVLLDKLDVDEAAALLAHNLAALEDFRRDGAIGRALRTLLLVVGAVYLTPRAAVAAPQMTLHCWMLWLLITLVTWSLSTQRLQRRVASWDRRAVELSGDPEALVRALIKGHELANIPRRWNQGAHDASMPPSLAARIQNIRQTAGLVGQTLDEEVVLESKEGGRYAILGPEQVWFLEGVAAGDPEPAAVRERAATSRAFAYRSLAALNLKLGMDGQAVLRATTAEGQQLRLPLATASIDRAQRAMELIEGKVPARTVTTAGLTALAALAWVLIVMAAAMAPAVPALVIAPIVLSRRRNSFAPMLGWAVVAFGAGLLGLAGADGTAAEPLIGAVAALCAGGVLAAVARQVARLAPAEIWRSYGLTVALLAGCALITFPSGLNAAWATGFALESMQIAGPLFALAVAALLLARHHRRLWARGLTLALVLAALSPAVVGADALRFCSRRALFPASSPVQSWPALPPARRALVVPTGLHQVGLSADGQRAFGARRWDTLNQYDYNLDAERRFQIWEPDGHAEVAAVALAFIDDRRLLAVRRAGNRLFVEEPGAGGWRADLPPMSSVELYADGARFRVIGEQRDHFTLVEGAIGGGETRSRETDRIWNTSHVGYRSSWIPSGAHDGALSVMLDYRAGYPDGLGFLWHLHPRPRTVVELESAGAPPRSLIQTWAQVSCPQVPPGSVQFACVASERDRSWLWWIDAGNQNIGNSMRLPGKFERVLRSGDALALQLEEGIVFQDRARLSAVGTPPGAGRLVAFSAHGFALIHESDGVGTLTIYPR